MSDSKDNAGDMDFPSISELFFYQELSSVAGHDASVLWLSNQRLERYLFKSALGKVSQQHQRIVYTKNESRADRSNTKYSVDKAGGLCFQMVSSNDAMERSSYKEKTRPAPATRSLSSSNVFRPKESWAHLKAMSKSCNSANMGLLFTDAAHTVLEQSDQCDCKL